jgi:hypothetical protein
MKSSGEEVLLVFFRKLNLSPKRKKRKTPSKI